MNVCKTRRPRRPLRQHGKFQHNLEQHVSSVWCATKSAGMVSPVTSQRRPVTFLFNPQARGWTIMLFSRPENWRCKTSCVAPDAQPTTR